MTWTVQLGICGVIVSNNFPGEGRLTLKDGQIFRWTGLMTWSPAEFQGFSFWSFDLLRLSVFRRPFEGREQYHWRLTLSKLIFDTEGKNL